MKQKQSKHLYEAKHRSAPTMRIWLMLFKAWKYEFQLKFGIIKHRHRRSIAVRNLRRLYGFTVSDLLQMAKIMKMICCSHGVGYEQPANRRLYVYYY